MIFRFCLYGFLKNLRFFEAFLILALRERGVDFFSIGALIAIREIAGNLSQIPSGAIADAFGRKRCMVASMAFYVVSYLILGLFDEGWILMLAMVFYGTADAFREGTHKALICAWLRKQGRENERTEVYGFTRSWSKLGSAVSAIGAAALVFFTGNYSTVFLLSIIPSALNLINLATYPSDLDDGIPRGGGMRSVLRHLADGFREVISNISLRRLVRDSMAMEGSYAAYKDYLQIALQVIAISLPLQVQMTADQRAAILIGAVYFILHLLSSNASRKSHRFEKSSDGTEPAIHRLYQFTALSIVLLGISLAVGWGWIAAMLFIGLGVLQNLWRPIHIGRFDRDGQESRAATTLSIESQASALSAAILAPCIGFAIDLLKSNGASAGSLHTLWPIALAGIPVVVIALVSSGKMPLKQPPDAADRGI